MLEDAELLANHVYVINNKYTLVIVFWNGLYILYT